jgi:hypothetical protein
MASRRLSSQSCGEPHLPCLLKAQHVVEVRHPHTADADVSDHETMIGTGLARRGEHAARDELGKGEDAAGHGHRGLEERATGAGGAIVCHNRVVPDGRIVPSRRRLSWIDCRIDGGRSRSELRKPNVGSLAGTGPGIWALAPRCRGRSGCYRFSVGRSRPAIVPRRPLECRRISEPPAGSGAHQRWIPRGHPRTTVQPPLWYEAGRSLHWLDVGSGCSA